MTDRTSRKYIPSRLRRCVALALISACTILAHPGLVHADKVVVEPDEPHTEGVPPPIEYSPGPARRTGSRIAFWSLAGVSVVSIGVYMYGVGRVQEQEDAKLDAVGTYQQDTGDQLSVSNVCGDARVEGAMAGDHPALLTIENACTEGHAWARRANAASLIFLASTPLALYFLYRGYLKKPASASTAVFAPVVTPETVGASLRLRF